MNFEGKSLFRKVQPRRRILAWDTFPTSHRPFCRQEYLKELSFDIMDCADVPKQQATNVGHAFAQVCIVMRADSSSAVNSDSGENSIARYLRDVKRERDVVTWCIVICVSSQFNQ